MPSPEFPLKATPLHLDADWEYEQDGDRQHYVVKALLERKLIGRAHGWFAPGARFVLDKIEMAPGHRSKGHGTALIEMLRAKARTEACTDFVIQSVQASNQRAIKLYESLGARAGENADGQGEFVISPP